MPHTSRKKETEQRRSAFAARDFLSLIPKGVELGALVLLGARAAFLT
jgi:hypothetical protein